MSLTIQDVFPAGRVDIRASTARGTGRQAVVAGSRSLAADPTVGVRPYLKPRDSTGQTRPDSHRTRLPAESKRGTRSDNPGPRSGEPRLITSQRVGNTRLVWVDATNPLNSQYRAILISTDGAPAVISQEFGSVRGIPYPYVYGSFAAKCLGGPGPAPDDMASS